MFLVMFFLFLHSGEESQTIQCLLQDHCGKKQALQNNHLTMGHKEKVLHTLFVSFYTSLLV